MDKAHIRSLAYAKQRETGLSLGQCYNEVAKEYGFKTYQAMRKKLNANDGKRSTKNLRVFGH